MSHNRLKSKIDIDIINHFENEKGSEPPQEGCGHGWCMETTGQSITVHTGPLSDNKTSV